MLTFEESSINAIVEEHHKAMELNKIPNGWGCGKIIGNFSGIQGLFFRLLGQKIRTPGGYTEDPGTGSHGATNQTFHPMVRIRKTKITWNPPALAGFTFGEPDGRGTPWLWKKYDVKPVPEYVMLPEKTISVSYGGEENGEVKYRSAKSLGRRLCPKEILQELDEANKIVIEAYDLI